jgi:hypothetical protein
MKPPSPWSVRSFRDCPLRIALLQSALTKLMKRTASPVLFALVSVCLWGLPTLRASAAVHDYVITYTNLGPRGAFGGSIAFTSGNQHGGDVNGFATIWNGPFHSIVNLHLAGWTWSGVMDGAGNQQVGYTYSTALNASRAALWNGSAASYVHLNPSGSSASMALATTGSRQAGYVTVGFQVRAGVWSGTASSFVNLHPGAGAVSSIAYAIAGDQQGGMVNYTGSAHAALWSGTAASYRNLHGLGPFQSSQIQAMTINQQVGYAAGRAGIWFGTAESFVDINPPGARSSEAHATVDTMQAGFAIFDSYRHAILWFGSATNYIDLHPALGSQYRASQAHSVWTDGSTILVAGAAVDWPGASHPILWNIQPPCALTCPADLVVCANAGQCGAFVKFTPPLATNCAGLKIECMPPSGSFFPVGTNLVTCIAKNNSNGQVKDHCSFQIIIRDCESPAIHDVSASPGILWPPNKRMQPVNIVVTATDNCELANSRIIWVTHNELDADTGSGHSGMDWQVTGDLSLYLRAERSTGGNGRIYTITVQCEDLAGNASTRTVSVSVPHDQR